MRRFIAGLALVVCSAATAAAQANGKLQIHFMDVGQGDPHLAPRGDRPLRQRGLWPQAYGLAGGSDVPAGYVRQLVYPLRRDAPARET